MLLKRTIAFSLFTLVLFLLACSSGNDRQKEQLGDIEFNVTGNEAARGNFEKGLLLLHSFEFEDAEDEFKKAIETDKDFVMAYWGLAMSHNHPLWRFQDFDKGNRVLSALAPTAEARVEKAKTGLEKDFIKSINILYGPGDKIERDKKYAAFLGELHRKYPDNNEVTAFYSLALLGSVPVGRDEKIYELAAEMAKTVLKTNPRHPGALHYLIHAYDDPAHAALAVKTADAYSNVAPAAGHALHMPTHIYLALGMWDKVISSNIDSWKASEERKKRKNLDGDALNFHAYHWLLYGYLQRGDKERAKNVLDSMSAYARILKSEGAREYMIYQKATYLTETGEFENEISGQVIKQDDLNIVTRAMDHYINGMRYYSLRDEEKMEQHISDLTAAILIDEERVSSTSASVCGAVSSPLPNSLDIQQSQVMLLELKAMHAWLKKDVNLAENFFKKAVALESGISYAYGPPTIVKPSAELYAEWLLEQGKPDKALVQFEHSLKATPGRTLSVKGKEKAAAMLVAVK